MKAVHRNVSECTRSGAGPVKNAARGETGVAIGFLALAAGEIQQGLPPETLVPCEGTGYGTGAMSLEKGARNLENAPLLRVVADGARAGAGGGLGLVHDPVEQGHAAAPADAPGGADEVRRLRPEEARLEGRAHAPHRALGARGAGGAEVISAGCGRLHGKGPPRRAFRS